jgi:hypothetical protein
MTIRARNTDPGTDPGSPDNPTTPDTPVNPNLPNDDDSASWPNIPWGANGDSLFDLGNWSNGDGWGDSWINEPGFILGTSDGPESNSWYMNALNAGIQSSTARSTKPTDNQPPVAASLRLRVDRGTSIRLDLLENASDPEGDPLTVLIVTAPHHGKLIANPDGSYTYLPEEGYLGEDSFTYKVNDGQLDSGIATVVLVVALAEDGIVEETGTEENTDGQTDRPGKSATIRLQSKLAYSFTKPQPDRYLILRGEKGKAEEKARDTPRIDWNGIAPVLACAPLWASPFLSRKKGKQDEEELDPKRLAEITGLRFPMEREGRDERE